MYIIYTIPSFGPCHRCLSCSLPLHLVGSSSAAGIHKETTTAKDLFETGNYALSQDGFANLIEK